MELGPHLRRPHLPALSRRGTHWLIALAVVVLVLGGLVFWLSLESTLQAAARWAVARSGGSLVIDQPHGSLLSRATASRIVWTTPTRTVTFDNVSMRWNPLWLLGGVVAVTNASADRAIVALTAGANQGGLTPPSSLKPRVRVRVARAHVAELDLDRDGTVTAFRNVGVTAGAGRSDWYFNLTPAQTPWGLLKADANIGQEAPFDVDARLEFTRDTPQAVSLVMTAKGPLERFALDATLGARDSKLVAHGIATPYAALPFTEVNLQLTHFDPRDFLAGAPHALLEGGVDARPLDAGTVRGELRIRNTASGPLDEGKVPVVALTGQVTGQPDALALDRLVLDLGKGGQLGGDASLRGTKIALTLAGNNLDGHALYTALKPSHLAARVGMTGDVRAQDVNVSFRQKDYDVTATGHIAPDAVVVKSMRARIHGGTLQASGRFGLGTQHPYAFEAKLTQFDLSRFGLTKPEIMTKPAILNATLSGKGATAPKLALDADLRVTSGNIGGLGASGQAHWRSLGTKNAHIALKGNAQVGATKLAFDGRVVDPVHLGSLDTQLDLSGPSMDQLYKVLGLPLPPTADYRIAGRLTYDDDVWSLRDFRGHVGGSDLAGDFSFRRSGKNAGIKANLVSQRLDIVDLQGFLGKRPGTPAAPTGKVLPQQPYDLAKLRGTEADVTFTGKRFANPTLPLTDMKTHLVLHEGLLTLNPLDFGMAGGNLQGFVTLDARKPVIDGSADLRGVGLQLNKLLPSVKAMLGSTGKVDARIRLAGQGNSFAALLGSADGSVASVMEGGSMSDVVLRLANLDIANTLVAMAKGNEKVPIRCVVANFKAQDGVLVPDPLLLDTEHTLVRGDGRVDLGRETLALKLVATPKDGSVFALRGPVDIQGPFAKPAVKPELGQAIARVGAAVALGAVAGPAAILPFLEPGTPAKVDCASYAAKARSFITERPAAAPAARQATSTTATP
jgi:uncharacterized protein involved in outer membrane biogenesis